jgi:hypothetical protein
MCRSCGDINGRWNLDEIQELQELELTVVDHDGCEATIEN